MYIRSFGKVSEPPTMLIFLIFFVSVFFRYFKSLPIVFEQGGITWNHDGFYFVRLAKEVANGTYGLFDYLRDFPNVVQNPPLPILISVIYGFFGKFTGVPYEQVDAFLGPWFACLFVFPLYYFWKLLGYPYVGIIHAASLSFYPLYFYRTVPGYSDTDSLIYFFLCLSAYFLLRAYLRLDSYSFWFSLLSSFMLFWWYYHPELSVLQYIGYFTLYYLKHRTLKNAEILGFIGLVILFDSLGSPIFMTIFYRLFTYIGFMKSQVQEETSSYSVYISELQRIESLSQFESFISGSPIVYLLSMIGLILLIVRKRWELFFLFAPALAVSLYFLVSLQVRFVMYLSFFIFAGWAFFVLWMADILHQKVRSSLLKNLLAPLLIYSSAFAFFSPAYLMPDFRITKDYYEFFSNLKSIKNCVENPAVLITALPDFGYALQYYGNVATYSDPGNNSKDRRLSSLAKTFIESPEKVQENFLKNLYSSQIERQEKGLPKIEKFYIFISINDISLYSIISNLAGRKTPVDTFLINCMDYVECQKREVFDKEKGIYAYDLSVFVIKSYYKFSIEGELLEERIYPAKGNRKFALYEKGPIKLLITEDDTIKNSTLINLYFKTPKKISNLQLVCDHFPYYVVYKLNF